jgi:predicted DsbA family dithiol-disulfide isomerase
MSRSGAIHAQLSGISVSATRVAAFVELIEFDLFYDYNCPFVYRASQMLEAIQESKQRELDVRWRYFSLSQVNSKEEGWTVWGAPESETVKGRLAFKAAEAARRQDAFGAFHMALLHSRHRDRLDIENPSIVERIAADSGLDLERFRRDVADPDILRALARDHQEARSTHGVFGTPTFVFPSGAAAYVRLAQAPSGDEAVRTLDRIVSVTEHEPSILEIKRPTRPTPD